MRYKVSKVPSVSVVIAAYRAGPTIEACLRSIEEQSYPPHEVIVVHSGGDDTPDLICRKFTGVRVFQYRERKYPGDARNIGVRQATGEIIAFIDADCVAHRDFVLEIVRAHQAPDPLIGGSIGNANPESHVGWAAYFCEISRWMPGGRSRRMSDVASACTAVKRWAFEKYGPFLEGTYCSDTAFSWRVAEDGFPPLFQPSIQVAHVNVTRVKRFMRKQVMHGRTFANVRIQERKLPCWRLGMLCFGAPALPLLLLARIVWRVMAVGRDLRRFFLVLPLVFAGLAAWSWGEWLGYWRGLWSVMGFAPAAASSVRSADAR